MTKFPPFDNLLSSRNETIVHYSYPEKAKNVLVHKEEIRYYTFEQLRHRLNELGDHYGDENCCLDISYEYGYYDSIEMNSYIQGFRDETDEEYAKRLEFAKEKRKEIAAQRRIEAKKREERQRKEYEKLKKKFEKDAK